MSRQQSLPLTRVAPIFFVSGVAGLIYEVTWVRQFGNLFGNTIHSASLIAAAFMLGLGVGSYVVGVWSDRKAKDHAYLLKAYAAAEFAIAGLAFAIAFFFRGSEALSAGMSSYTQIGEGWFALSFSSQAYRYLIACLLVGPVTFLMGGTLPLLYRALVQKDLGDAGRKMGFLYGTNTAGAALGAFLVDAALIPGCGVFATQGFGVLLNLAAGLAALRLATGQGKPAAQAEPAPRAGTASSAVIWAVCAALVLAGFSAMGTQVLWYRFLSSALGSTRSVFSMLLVTILVGIWLGSWVGGVVEKRFKNAPLIFIYAQALFAATTLVTLMIFDRSMQSSSSLEQMFHESQSSVFRAVIEYFYLFRVVAWVCGIPAFFTGFSFPVANACVQDALGAVGRRAGALYLANTAGAVLGSLLAGFYLLPRFGTQASFTVLTVATILGLFPLAYVAGRLTLGAAGLALLALASLGAWASHPGDWLLKRLYSPFEDGTKRFIAYREGLTESLAVLDNSETHDRLLYTNGFQMSGTDPLEQRYMRSFSHIPLLQLEKPTDVLVICFGVGNTAYAASLHDSVRRIEIADLSQDILEQASSFERWNHNVLKDPRVSVFINDGRQHLRMSAKERFDLVTLEPPPLNRAGVASLYTKEFYSLVYEHLKPGGFLTEWLPVGQQSAEAARSLIRAFVDVFPDTILFSGYAGHLVLMGRKGMHQVLDPVSLEAKLKRAPGVRADLESVNLGSLVEIAGSFVNSAAGLRPLVENAVPLSDDYPIMEYSVLAFASPITLPGLVDVGRVRDWCPDCIRSDGSPGVVPGLSEYLAALRPIYGTMNTQSPATKLALAEPSEAELRRLAGKYRYLGGFLRFDR